VTSTVVRDVQFTADDYLYAPTAEKLDSLVVLVRLGDLADPADLADATRRAQKLAERLATSFRVVLVAASDEEHALARDVEGTIVGGAVRVVRDGDTAFADAVRGWSGPMDWVLVGDATLLADVDAAELAGQADEADALLIRRAKRPTRGAAVLLVRSRTLGRLGWSTTALVGSPKALRARFAQKRVLARSFVLGEAGALVRARTKRGGRTRLHVANVLRAEWWRSSDPAVQQRSAVHLVAFLAVVAGVVATAIASANGDLLAFGDAQSHLNISKRVVSGLTPGLAQLGSVWLPLPHLLMVPFVAPDWLWRTGLAGAIVGVPALALLSVNAYRLAALLTGNGKAALVAPVVILANPNVLYMTATPMTEVLLLALMMSSLYHLARWVQAPNVRDLVLAGVFAQLASLTRYDGWFLVLVETVVVVSVTWWRARSSRTVDGSTFLFSAVAFSGMALWFVWNLLIFSDPFYFARSEYSAKEQQRAFEDAGLYPTLHNIGKSVVYWLDSVQLIAGPAVVAVGVVGLVLMLVALIRRRAGGMLLVAGATFSSFVFYIGSLYTGDAVIMLPRFTEIDGEPVIYNVRYGLMAMVPIALVLAFVARHRQRLVVPVILIVLLAQGGQMLAADDVMAYRDGVEGLGGAVARGPESRAVEEWMKDNYDGGLVLMDDFQRPIGQVESGISMSAFIGSGTKPYWQESLEDPGVHATWLVVRQVDSDAVWGAFDERALEIVDEYFEEVYVAGDIHVYERDPLG
jgi:hypothetical protein